MISFSRPTKNFLLGSARALFAGLIATTLLHCANSPPGPIESTELAMFQALDRVCGGTAAVERAFFSDDGSYVAKLCSPVVVSPQTYTVAVWKTDGSSFSPLFTLPASKEDGSRILSAAFSQDGQLLVGRTLGAELWDIQSHTLVSDFSGTIVENKPCQDVAFSKAGLQFAIASDSALYLFDAHQKKLLAAFTQANDLLHVQQVSFSPDDAFLLGIALDPTKQDPNKKAFVWKLGASLGQDPVLQGMDIQGAAFEPFFFPKGSLDAPHNYVLAVYKREGSFTFDPANDFLMWPDDKLYFYQSILPGRVWSPEGAYSVTTGPIAGNNLPLFTRNEVNYPVPSGSDTLAPIQAGDTLLNGLFTSDGRSLFVASRLGLYRWNLVRRPLP